MNDIEGMLALFRKGKYKDAAIIFDSLPNNKKTPELWYLRGVIALKLGNVNHSLECFERALLDGGDKRHILKAMASVYMREGNFLQAKEHLEKIEKKDVEDYFLLAVASIFLNDPISAKEYMNLAYLADREKTKTLLEKFYMVFIKPNPELTEKEKSFLWKKIESIR